MFLNIKNYFYIIIFLFIALLLISCSNSNDHSEEHDRPDSIPKTALWVGGTDDGVYLEIKKNENDKPNIYSVVIYHSSGDIDYKGKLSITNNELNFKYKNSESYSSWDGDTLYLQDGRELKIVSK